MRKSTIIAVILSGVFALCALSGSWYALSSIDTMREALISERGELKKEENRSETILDVKRQLKRLEVERTELGQYFYAEEDIVGLLEELEDLARHAQVDMSVNSATAIEKEGKTVFRTGMKIEGTWQDSLYFIEMVESLPLRLELIRVNLSGGETGDRWNGEVLLDLLSFIPKKAIQ